MNSSDTREEGSFIKLEFQFCDILFQSFLSLAMKTIYNNVLD